MSGRVAGRAVDPETTVDVIDGTVVVSLGPKDAQADAERAHDLAERADRAVREYEARAQSEPSD